MLEHSDMQHLRRAFELASRARDEGSHPFGALLVNKAGSVLGESVNTVLTAKDCIGHAETNLLRRVCPRVAREALRESTLYSSTEPCAMCAGAICWSGVGRVVYGVSERRLAELVAGDPDKQSLAMSCREVFAMFSQKIEAIGPALESEGEKAHIGFWKTGPQPSSEI